MPDDSLERYAEALNALAAETLACVPPSWTRATLTIDCDGRAINYSLKNVHEPDKASISAALRSACERLYVTMARDGDAWRQAVLALERADGAWKLSTTFDYEHGSDEPGIAAAKARREDERGRW